MARRIFEWLNFRYASLPSSSACKWPEMHAAWMATRCMSAETSSAQHIYNRRLSYRLPRFPSTTKVGIAVMRVYRLSMPTPVRSPRNLAVLIIDSGVRVVDGRMDEAMIQVWGQRAASEKVFSSLRILGLRCRIELSDTVLSSLTTLPALRLVFFDQKCQLCIGYGSSLPETETCDHEATCMLTPECCNSTLPSGWTLGSRGPSRETAQELTRDWYVYQWSWKNGADCVW